MAVEMVGDAHLLGAVQLEPLAPAQVVVCGELGGEHIVLVQQLEHLPYMATTGW